MDKLDFKVSNNSGYRYILGVIENFSKFIWCIPLENKYGETIKLEFSNILKTSRRKLNIRI